MSERARTRRRSWSVGVAAGLLSFACLGAQTASGEQSTTSPGQHVDETVLLQPAGISVGGNARLPRGVDVTFFVKNLTKTTENFKILGKTTPPIKPGHSAKLSVTLAARGVFPYQSTIGDRRAERGLFVVY
jgi:hypothetical protein